MRMATEETRKDKIGHIGQEIVDGVPLGVTAMASPMALYPSTAEERPIKNCTAQHIGCGIKTTENAS